MSFAAPPFLRLLPFRLLLVDLLCADSFPAPSFENLQLGRNFALWIQALQQFGLAGSSAMLARVHRPSYQTMETRMLLGANAAVSKQWPRIESMLGQDNGIASPRWPVGAQPIYPQAPCSANYPASGRSCSLFGFAARPGHPQKSQLSICPKGSIGSQRFSTGSFDTLPLRNEHIGLAYNMCYFAKIIDKFLNIGGHAED